MDKNKKFRANGKHLSMINPTCTYRLDNCIIFKLSCYLQMKLAILGSWSQKKEKKC